MFQPLCIYHVIKNKKRKKKRRYQLCKEKVLNPSNGIFFAFSATMLQNRQRRKSNIIYYKALSSVFFFTVAFICIVLSRATLRWRCILFRTTHNTTHSYNRLFINDRLSIVNIVCGINLGCTSFIQPSNK